MPTIHLYSKYFLEEEDMGWSARPSSKLVQWLHRRYQEETVRWIVNIALPNATLEQSSIPLALGDPIPHSQDQDMNLYLPYWILQQYGFEGQGEEIDVEFHRCEQYAKAQSLKIQVLNEIPADFDLREVLEEPLSHLGVLEEGRIIPCPVLEGTMLLVREITPPGVPVFLDGNEIRLEIEVEQPEPPTPPPFPQPQAEPQDLSGSSMIPLEALTPPQTISRQTRGQRCFIPFSGPGRALGRD